MVILTEKLWFPNVEEASAEGIVAIGGDLSQKRLELAYKSGIFPWYNPGEPIIWYSPDPRMVLFPDRLKISKSMKQILRKQQFTLSFNTDFKQVIAQCKTIDRKGQQGSWITDEMQIAYLKLHQSGLAKSVEVWSGNDLAGGLYGIDLGNLFCGESMFSKKANASKVAFIGLIEKLKLEKYQLVDCQVYTEHLERLGAEEIPRSEFLKYL